MLRKILFHFIGAALIFFGWYICVTSVGLDRGATTFQYFSKVNVFGLVLIFSGSYFPEVATWILSKKD